MKNNSIESIDSRPVYEDCLPLSWNALNSKPDSAVLLAIQNENEETLKVICSLDEVHHENDDPQGVHAQQLMRLDAKVNFLMDMVGQLLLNSLTIPAATKMSLSADGIQWIDRQALDIGDYIHVQLYLKVKYPNPVILPALVKSVTRVEGGYKITSEFDSLSTGVEEWIEKLIFRHHRRAIALSRR